MKTGRAFLAGVVGGLVMTAIMAMARAMGMPANLEIMLGTMLGLAPGGTAWAVGLAMHLMISGLLALVYAWGFEALVHRAGWAAGLGFGFVHALFAGIFMAMIPAMHPLIPEQMPAPGAFMANLGGIGIVAEFMMHLIYGAIVGAIYGPVEPRRSIQAHEQRRVA